MKGLAFLAFVASLLVGAPVMRLSVSWMIFRGSHHAVVIVDNSSRGTCLRRALRRLASSLAWKRDGGCCFLGMGAVGG